MVMMEAIFVSRLPNCQCAPMSHCTAMMSMPWSFRRPCYALQLEDSLEVAAEALMAIFQTSLTGVLMARDMSSWKITRMFERLRSKSQSSEWRSSRRCEHPSMDGLPFIELD